MSLETWKIAGATGIALLLASAGVAALAGRGPDPSAMPAGSVVEIPVHGVIELGLAPFIARSIEEAEQAGVRAIILDIETPGGRIDAAQQIVDALRDADVPVYAFVNRRAFSAGAMIALAADRIFMRSGGVIGAATPITGDGAKASEKIVSAMRSEMRALAEEAGLDPLIAEAMVDESIEIPGVVASGKLLTLTTEEAVRVGYAQEVAGREALLGQLGIGAEEVSATAPNWAENVVRFLTHPAVAPLLLSLGFLGIIIEFKTPAFGLAGTVGVGALTLFFGSRYLVGLAGLEELLLLGAGVALIAAEMFLIPGFGVAGIAGALAAGAGIYLSLVGDMATAAELSTAAGVLSLSLLVGIIIGWALLRKLPRTGRFSGSGIMLSEATRREIGYTSSTSRDELLGAVGVALTDLRPSGSARFGDEHIDVVSDSTWISAGTPVRIVRAEGYRHVVRATDSA